MPEAHEAGVNEGGFVASTPDLTPNLENPDGSLNEVGQQNQFDKGTFEANQRRLDEIADDHLMTPEKADTVLQNAPLPADAHHFDVQDVDLAHQVKDIEAEQQRVKERFRDNEIAIKNQAMNEASRAGEVIEYAPYTVEHGVSTLLHDVKTSLAGDVSLEQANVLKEVERRLQAILPSGKTPEKAS